MILSEPERYKLIVRDHLRYAVENQYGMPQFSSNASSRMPKLYVVSAENYPLYVGVTAQPMRKRLQQGFSASGERGYYGYKWRVAISEKCDVALDVWCHLDAEIGSIEDIEILESEVVYQIRSRWGQWPPFQTEIHFHHSKCIHRKAALEIMELYTPSLRQMADVSPEYRVLNTGHGLCWNYDLNVWEDWLVFNPDEKW